MDNIKNWFSEYKGINFSYLDTYYLEEKTLELIKESQKNYKKLQELN